MSELFDGLALGNAIDNATQASQEALTKRIAELERSYLVAQELTSNGVKMPKLNSCDIYGFIVHVKDLQEFRLIKEVVGPLEKGHLTPAGDGREAKVWVFMVPKDKDLKHIQFKYLKKLPKGAKCKVKTVSTKYRTVVCE